MNICLTGYKLISNGICVCISIFIVFVFLLTFVSVFVILLEFENNMRNTGRGLWYSHRFDWFQLSDCYLSKGTLRNGRGMNFCVENFSAKLNKNFGSNFLLLSTESDCTYLIFVISFTQTRFLEKKIYTKKLRKLRQTYSAPK